MTTFITWQTAGGKKGRCDARCHNAKRTKCKCCCGGLAHGSANGKSTTEQQEHLAGIVAEVTEQAATLQLDGHLKTFNVRPQQQKLPM